MANRTPYEMALDTIGELWEDANNHSKMRDDEKALFSEMNGFNEVAVRHAHRYNHLAEKYDYAARKIINLTSRQFNIPCAQVKEDALNRKWPDGQE